MKEHHPVFMLLTKMQMLNRFLFPTQMIKRKPETAEKIRNRTDHEKMQNGSQAENTFSEEDP